MLSLNGQNHKTSDSMSTYTVVKGDTLFAIARKFGITVAELKSLNGLKTDTLKIGQALKVPGQTPATPPPPPVKPPVQPPANEPQTSPFKYKVVKGDTLYGISRRFGVSVYFLKKLNNMDSAVLRVGQVLLIPNNAATPPAPPPSTPQTPPSPPPVVAPANYLEARRQFGLVVRPDTGFQRFELTVPLLNGETLLARMRDNVTYSAYMQYPIGIVYGGQSTIHIPVERVESVGLNRKQAAALEYVSSHEGKYDAINSYDKGIFSFGSIQFVGAAEHGASLNDVLAGMKANAPAKFAQVFQQVGIDSTGFTTTVLDETGRKLSGDEAWLYIQKTVPLYGAFIRAGFDPDLVLEQLRAANNLYVQLTLNAQLNLLINGARVLPKLSDILSSEGLLTALIAIAINRGNGAMRRMMEEVLNNIATTRKLTSLEALRQLDERLICQTIADTSTDVRIRDRAQGALNGGLSFAKA